jgi:hypothetical protein
MRTLSATRAGLPEGEREPNPVLDEPCSLGIRRERERALAFMVGRGSRSQDGLRDPLARLGSTALSGGAFTWIA